MAKATSSAGLALRANRPFNLMFATHFSIPRSRETDMLDFQKAGGVVPAIAQDADTGQVLMLAWMNAEAFAETVRTGRACYFSRSRDRLWRKGEESTHIQEVRGIYIDCDADTVLLKVKQVGGAACHEGYSSCFFRQVEGEELRVIAERVFDPKSVYKKVQTGLTGSTG
jgi:phosphoribosyl-AMP cyclohydrolase